MNRIVTCFKAVPFEEDIQVDSYSRKIKYDDARYVIGLYDKNAIETGTQLFEKLGGKYTALTVGGDEKILATRKDAMSRGPEELCAVIDEKLKDADSLVTANAIAAAVKKFGDVGLVICAEGSGDVYAQQVGPRVGQALGWPVVAYVTSIEVNDGVATITRKLDDCVETIQCALPMVITIAGDSNSPRIPNFKAIMAAGKKPLEQLTVADIGLEEAEVAPGVVTVKVEGNIPERKRIVFEDDVTEAVDKLVRQLIADACLS